MATTLSANSRILTHHEINALASERTRERWAARGILPTPKFIRVDRQRLALYSDWALLCVAAGRHPDPAILSLLEKVGSVCGRLMRTSAQRELEDAARDAMRAVLVDGDWDFRRFVTTLGDLAADPLAAWQSELDELTAPLDTRLSVIGELGSIKEWTEDMLVIGLDSGVDLAAAADAVVVPSSTGDAVIVDRVGLGRQSTMYVVPALSIPHVETGAREVEEVEDMHIPNQSAVARLLAHRPKTVEEILGIASLNLGSPREDFEQGFLGLPEPAILPVIEPSDVYQVSVNVTVPEAN